MSWLFLLVAGLFEVVGVTGMQMITNTHKVKGIFTMVAGMITSFFFLSLAMQTIPLGIAYAVWTGIGTVGSTIVGLLFYGESKDRRRICFIGIVVAAIIGLRLSA